MNTAIEVLKKQGINKVVLVAFETDELGKFFWKPQGFQEKNDLVYINKSINNDL